MALIQSTAIPSGATDYEIEQSLKFTNHLGRKNNLSWTAGTPTNQKIWTLSFWIKKTVDLTGNNYMLSAGTSGDQNDTVQFSSTGQLDFGSYSLGYTHQIKTNAIYRDPSSWYHYLIAFDTTQSTETNRIKMYVNGVQQTSLHTANYPSLNATAGHINAAELHQIGKSVWHDGGYLGAYLAEYNFVDGQALTPADFGETGDYGEWKPVEYSGTYGNNGFYLPFKQDYTVEGFSTVTYKGNGTSQYIGGVGFSPDLVWAKRRDAATSHGIADSVRGVRNILSSNGTAAEYAESAGNTLTAFDTDGFTVGADGNYTAFNASGSSIVAWNWDMGGSNATNTDGSYTSTVRANTTYGQSIVSYDATKVDNATVGHGLNSAPEMIIAKGREEAYNWITYHKDLNGGTNPHTKYVRLNNTNAEGSGNYWGNAQPTSDVFTIGADEQINPTNSKGVIAYCFHSVTGYSKIGSYSGTGSNVSVTTGFAPAFTMVKRVDSADSWFMFDNTREPDGVVDLRLEANTNVAEATVTTGLTYTSTGFTVTSTNGAFNANGGTYIYIAFADKREYAYWLDQSGNNNDWTSNNLTESDISVDSPTNNFATFSPLMLAVNMGTELSEGNLKNYEGSTHSGYPHNSFSTMSVISGKWYFEVRNTLAYGAIGICNLSDGGVNQLTNSTASPLTNMPSDGEGWAFKNGNGNKEHNNSNVSYGSAITSNDVVMCAFDVDAGKIWWGVNGTWIASGNPATAANPAYTGENFGDACPVVTTENGSTAIINFGQDSSFAGNKTAQGNQDGNSIGDFYYTPPTGFLALCTKNLPDVAVVPSEHFNTVLYSGNSSTNNITGVGFQPDFVWGKGRNYADHHFLADAVRGSTTWFKTNSAGAESDYSSTDSGIRSFASDGFNLAADGSQIFNNSGKTYVAWNWKANGSGSSNTDGSITSTVSANVDAGFSIVTYTGTGSTATVGHGLSKAPDMMIIKTRGVADNWLVGANAGSMDYTDGFYLDSTLAKLDSDTFFNDTTPTSSVFTVKSHSTCNTNNGTYIAYCFHSVDGYSKVGSYTGNSSADGTFVYTGFRVKWILMKNASRASSWYLVDTEQDSGFNSMNTTYSKFLYANLSNAQDSPSGVDFLSNGFKLRTPGTGQNYNTDTIIYLAFASVPFKFSNAR